MPLTEIDLVEMVYSGLDLPKKQCVNAVDSVFDIIKDELARGNDVMISGFGKWSIKSKKQRRGRHPQTGQETIISARKVVAFKCSEKLKGELEQKKSHSNTMLHTLKQFLLLEVLMAGILKQTQ